MLISYSHRFLFAHIPKTAGCSLRETLDPYVSDPKRYAVNRLLERVGIRVNHLIGPPEWKRFRLHEEMRTVHRVLPAPVFASLFKFAFVRNPWDLLVSRYHYLLRQPRHRQHARVKRMTGFGEYARWHAARTNETQLRRIADRNGRLLVDFVGRFESLHDDFAEVQRRIGLQPAAIPHENQSARNDYRTYYDDATAEFVAERWRADVERFDYRFDAPGGCKAA
ncbi:MAG: sulfotransferase family 2 domain-containing protein [Planctomycetota bacterium]